MQKIKLLILLFGMLNTTLAAQNLNIPLRFLTATMPKNASVLETTEFNGKYKHLDFRNATQPELTKYDRLGYKNVYKNNRLQTRSLFDASKSERTIKQIAFEYDGNQIKKTTVSMLKLVDNYTYDLALEQTITAAFRNDTLVSETVRDDNGQILEQYDYLPPTVLNTLPLIRYTHTLFDQGEVSVQTENTLQYDDTGLVIYCSTSGIDTLYSITTNRVSDSEYKQTYFDGKRTIESTVHLYFDAIGNLVLTTSEEKDSTGAENKRAWYRRIKYRDGSLSKNASQIPAEIPENTVEIALPTKEEDTPVVQLPIEEVDANTVYPAHKLDQKPSFQGSDAAALNYFKEHIKYPEEAKSKNIRGRVIASFVIEKDGSLSDIKILRDIGGGCGKEVLRVLQKMPPWKPGMINGQAVRTKEIRPVAFHL